MFERPAVASETRADDIAENIRELCKLDSAYVPQQISAKIIPNTGVQDVC